ncbi:MAG: hypothetical protein ACUVQY_03760 [Thermoproteota archaeon]
MARKGLRILLDAEILVKLAYLTVSEEVDLKDLETLRLTYERTGGPTTGEVAFEDASLELTPLEELHRFCEDALKASESLTEEDK